MQTFKRSWDGVYTKPDNLVDLFEDSARTFSGNRCFGTKNAAGDYEWVTYGAVAERVDHVRGGLSRLGVAKNDKVGIIAGNRTEWMVCAYATYGLEASFVPMYEKELLSAWRYIIQDSAVKVLFVSNAEIYAAVKDFPKEIPTLKKIVTFDAIGPDSLEALEKAGQSHPVPAKKPSSSDIAVLIYTSGTTGDPKGVLLSHGNLTSCSQAGWHLFTELDEHAVSLSHLPWAHTYGLSAELNNWLQFGGAIAFMGSLETLAADMQKVCPTYLISVPRVFNKIYAKINDTMREAGGLKQKLFRLALDAAREKRETGKAGLKYRLLDRAVFGKIRRMFGGKLQGALTASAKMNPEVAQFFFDIGIPVYDCYGMTETSPAVTMSHRTRYRSGSLGKPLEKIDVVIDTSKVDDGSGDGEIIIYGPNVMQGYHNKPEKTREILTADGGVRSGDRGRLDKDGFLYITGRFKEEYKLENGKYVFPAEIEEEMKLLPYIANVVIYGDGKPYNVALIYPNLAALEPIARTLKFSVPVKELLGHKEILKLVTAEIGNHLRQKFGGYEIPQRIAFLDEDFTVENGLLTQTLKPKRNRIVKQYEAVIRDLYPTESSPAAP